MTTLTFNDINFSTYTAAVRSFTEKFGIGVGYALENLSYSQRSAEKKGNFGFVADGMRWIYGSMDYLGERIFKRKRTQTKKNLRELVKFGFVLSTKYKTDRGWVNAYSIDIRKFLELYYRDFKEAPIKKESVGNPVESLVLPSLRCSQGGRFPTFRGGGFRPPCSLYIYYPKNNQKKDTISWIGNILEKTERKDIVEEKPSAKLDQEPTVLDQAPIKNAELQAQAISKSSSSRFEGYYKTNVLKPINGQQVFLEKMGLRSIQRCPIDFSDLNRKRFGLYTIQNLNDKVLAHLGYELIDGKKELSPLQTLLAEIRSSDRIEEHKQLLASLVAINMTLGLSHKDFGFEGYDIDDVQWLRRDFPYGAPKKGITLYVISEGERCDRHLSYYARFWVDFAKAGIWISLPREECFAFKAHCDVIEYAKFLQNLRSGI